MFHIIPQLRVCSGHFHGGVKREGDIPVADPAVDPPKRIELPPKTPPNEKHRTKRKRPTFGKDQDLKPLSPCQNNDSASSSTSTGLKIDASLGNSLLHLPSQAAPSPSSLSGKIFLQSGNNSNDQGNINTSIGYYQNFIMQPNHMSTSSSNAFYRMLFTNFHL